MPYEALTYRILIASPSDVDEERDIISSIIQSWNDLNSSVRRIVLLPVRWETHTAPEYGNRPQAIINRAIVDDCDLLVGVFWTRIGSPTGVADSGTIEEIERVGKAGKPVMLYFSRVEVDPEKIDTDQITRLKEFKSQTYPKGLVENYRTRVEFRDKFYRQLEMKVRDLHESHSSHSSQLSISFISITNKNPLGNQFDIITPYSRITDKEDIAEQDRKEVDEFLDKYIKEQATFPLVMSIVNSGDIGLKNLYLEVSLQSSENEISVLDSSPSRLSSIMSTYLQFNSNLIDNSSAHWEDDLNQVLSDYKTETLQKSKGSWKFTLDWDALQSGRTRLVKPVLYLRSFVSTAINVKVIVYCDTLTKPIKLEATVKITVESRDVKIHEAVPDWQARLEEKRSREKDPLRLRVSRQQTPTAVI